MVRLRLLRERRRGSVRAIAESLAQAGADIVVADLDPSRSKDTVAAVEQLGARR